MKNTTSSKIWRLVIVIAVLGFVSGIGFAADPQLKLISQCPNGKLYQYGEQKVLMLSGTPYQMGYAHGKLLAKEVNTLCHRVLLFCKAADIVRKKKPFSGRIDVVYKRLEPFIPQRYQEEMKGLADGSGVPLETIRHANIFPALFHCSGFAIFGDVTKDGKLLHGRVLDYITNIGLQSFALTIIARPDNYNAFVNISYTGFIGSVTGMNEKQIAIGEMGGRGEGKWDGMPMGFLFRKALEEADTLDEAVNVFKNNPRTCEYYYVVSDGKISDARGLVCSPEKCGVLKPGQKHERLPEVMDDTVVFSGTSRLRVLMKRLRAGYGTFTPQSAIKLMERPVAMSSNLHNVLFAPQTLEFWVAHAAIPPQKKYQACYQRYHHYDLDEMLKFFPEPAPKPVLKKTPKQPVEPVALSGVVPASAGRAMATEQNAELAAKLSLYAVKPAEFKWKMRPLRKVGRFQIFSLQFPSAFKSQDKQNDTVYCEYYPAVGEGKKPGVIVLHILAGKFILSRFLCKVLADNGINTLMVKMPYYGERRPQNPTRSRRLLEDPATLVDAMAQGVVDIRRAARWLAVRPETDKKRIGLLGMSLGGLIGSLTGGVDGKFPRMVFVLAGGDLKKILTTKSRETRSIRAALEKNKISPEKLRELLIPVEPLTYASRLKNCNVLMINASEDKIVPPACARKLQKASGAKIIWYRADHYSMVRHLPTLVFKVIAYFKQDNWDLHPSL